MWDRRNVLVTGCTGLLGSCLTQRLLEAGAHVIGLVRDSVPQSNFHRYGLESRVVVVRGSVEDYFTVERTLNEYEIDTIFHLAAQTIVSTANASPLSTFESNVKGTWTVLEAARHHPGVRRIVVASSDKAYGSHDDLPYAEDTPLQGRHPYDVSKSCADLVAQSYHHTYRLPIGVTRCGNLYGPGDLNFDRLIPGTIRSVLWEERPIIRSDGSFIRDYFFVEDAARAYMILADQLDRPELHGQAFNFSDELQITVLDMVRIILRLMDREDLTPIVQGGGQAEIRHQYLSSAKARELLGWSVAHSLEEGLAITIDWYRQFFAAEEGSYDRGRNRQAAQADTGRAR